MSRVEELIKEYCPNGVEYKKIADVSKYEQPSKYIVKNTNYDDLFTVPVLTAGQSFILGYTNEQDGIYNASKEDPVIIFDDFTGSFKWVDFPFKVKSSAIKIIRSNNNVLLRYLYHCMSFLNFSSSEHKRLWLRTYSNFKIPVPSLPVQEEIVRTLDTFIDLTTDLTTELTARKKQYEYYRNEILSFNGEKVERLLKRYCPNEVEYKKIKEIAEVGTGNSNGNEASKDGEYPFFIRSKTVKRKNTYEYDEEAIIIPGEGGIGEIYHYINGKYALHQRVYRIHFISSSINAKFAYYYFNAKFKNFIDKKAVSATVKSIRKPMIESFTIPVPPLPVQEEIVRVLDNFDKLNNSIINGLPAEIEARKKQYEYYRNRLLTFNESIK